MAAFLTWTTKAGASKSLFFDVCTEEGQDLTSTATEHPVEDGPNVTDHVKRELDAVNLEVFVSQTPIYDFNDRGGKVTKVPMQIAHYKAPLAPTPGAVFSAIGGAAKNAVGALLGKKAEYGAQVLKWATPFDAVADTLAILEKLKDEVQLVDVVLPSKVYESMALVHITVSGNAGTGTGRTFALQFREIRKVKVRIVNAPVPTESRGEVKKPKGAQGPKDSKAPGPQKSVAKAIVGVLPTSIQDALASIGIKR